MKKSLLILITSLFFITLNCKENKEGEQKESKKELIKPEKLTLKIKINAKVLIDDVFELFYNEDGGNSFPSNNALSIKVKGNTAFQDIVFELPENVNLERLRLDFGQTPKQQDIILNTISILYGEKIYTFSKAEIDNEFIANKFLNFNTKTRVITGEEIDGRYDPFFTSKKTKNIVSDLKGETKNAVKEAVTFIIKINAKVLVDDVFEVYFHQIGDVTYHPQDVVSTKIVGNKSFQDIIFKLPLKIYPERLRFDFGRNQKQQDILLKTISIFYGDKKHEFTELEIENEFKPNEFIDFNKLDYVIKTKTVSGKYDPYIQSKNLKDIVNYLIED